MNIIEMTAEGRLILVLDGMLDSLAAPAVRDRIMAALQGDAPKVLFDCENLVYISSAGLRILFEAAGRAVERGIQLAAFGVREEVLNIFNMVDLPSELPIHRDRSSALA